MLRILMFVVDLFVLLPWWGALGVLAAIGVGLYLLGHYIVHRIFKDTVQAVLDQGKPLQGALATVHSVQPAVPPAESSPFDSTPDDEDYDPDLDGNWGEEDGFFFRIDATITPKTPDTSWKPSALSIVPADFEPSEDLEFSEHTALLHSVEIQRNGRFEPLGDESVTGPQRVRLLIAVPSELQDAKFAYFFTYFGRVTIPAALATAR